VHDFSALYFLKRFFDCKKETKKAFIFSPTLIMKSRIAEVLKLKFEPVAIIWSDEMPEGAKQFKKGQWGCVIWMLARAARGEIVAFGREHYGCQGGATGLGFGNRYYDFIGGIEGFCRFLSTGFKGWKEEVLEKIKDELRDELYEKMLNGERYKKSPELVRKFIEKLPAVEIQKKYVIFKPLSKVENEEPVVVVFIANPHQLSALVVLANYSRETNDNVIIPMGAGCHQIGIYPYREMSSERPRAVVGLTDLDARLNVRALIGDDVFTFSVPYSMFREMEENVKDSFLEIGTWTRLMKYV
jgi:uncharacterized protein (DUF169 family)